VAIQINGKLRATIDVPVAASKAETQGLAMANTSVHKHLQGQSPKRVIVVPGKIVNIVL